MSQFVFDSDPTSEWEEDHRTWTITFSESVENHVGMQQIGKINEAGLSIEQLEKFQKVFEKKGYDSEVYNLVPFADKEDVSPAKVLIVRGGVKALLNKDEKFNEFMEEITETENVVDKKAWMRGQVKNKNARYNLCYADHSQEPNYEEKKGTIISFKDVPYLSQVRKNLGNLCGLKDLFAELNYYYDNRKCGIGFHGDSERKIVVGLRFGSSMNLHYQWFHQGSPIGDRVVFNLHHGDLYFMSEKAAGTDWKKKKIPTLRHAAGASTYTKIKEK